MTSPDESARLLEAIQKQADIVADRLDADIFVYNGAIIPPHDEQVIEACADRRRRPNVFCSITTSGGSPHSAYRIARALQTHYTKVIAYVPGYCKSAGTLVLLGAHELVLAHHADLGPLDIQAPATEVGERSSALAPAEGVMTIEQKALDTLDAAFSRMRDLGLSTAMAAERATAFATQLYEPLMRQIDPIRLAEMDRANRIMVEYGVRLFDFSGNAVDRFVVYKLCTGYPSHGFVIDEAEAKKLFKNVRRPEADEIAFAGRTPLPGDKALHIFFNTEREDGRRESPIVEGSQPGAEPIDGGIAPPGETRAPAAGSAPS